MPPCTRSHEVSPIFHIPLEGKVQSDNADNINDIKAKR